MKGKTDNMSMLDVPNIAHELFKKYNLKDWSFQLDHAKSRAGLCIYNKKIISLSRYYVGVSSLKEIKNTILHEIAHALVGHIHGHDHVWKAKALEIGCDGRRCHNKVFLDPKWIMQCPNGCFKIPRHRKKKHLICKSCEVSVEYLLNNV